MESTSSQSPVRTPTAPAPLGRSRVWLRRLGIGVACAPLAVIGILHKMGRSGDFGVLGEWYVLVPLTLAALLAWHVIERATAWATRSAEPAPESESGTP